MSTPPQSVSVVILAEPTLSQPPLTDATQPTTQSPDDATIPPPPKPTKESSRAWAPVRIVASSISRVFRNDWAICSLAPAPGTSMQLHIAEKDGAVDFLPEETMQHGATWLTAGQWNALAAHAISTYQPKLLVLLRAGYTAEPKRLVDAVKACFKANPTLRCLAIGDAEEPGTPAAIAVGVQHYNLFNNQLFPMDVDGPDTNHFLYQLYRRIGGSDCHVGTTVRFVHQHLGGMGDGNAHQHGDADQHGDVVQRQGLEQQQQPLCTRVSSAATPSRWLGQLDEWGGILRNHYQRTRLVVDVCVPSYRVQYTALQRIVGCPWDRSRADVRFLVQIDNPRHKPKELAQLAELRASMGHRLTIRMNSTNLGRSGARNACLDGSGAEYCIFFDDDVEPMQHCIDAYVAAFMQHPEARCFAGPTYMPLVPKPMPMAVHMSGVIDFWEVPEWYGSTIPWAITANVAYKNTKDVRFRFPKKGGGEDVDFCLQLGACTIAVPPAQAVHPWWPGTRINYYKRMFRWFEGDGMLIKTWPQHAYVTAPSALMVMTIVALLTILRVWSIPMGLLMAWAMWMSDVMVEIVRECCVPARRRYTPGPLWLRPRAALESALLKTVSEFGRVYGHYKVDRPVNMLKKFDWFCGYEPSYVATQQRIALAKLLMFVVAGAGAWSVGRWAGC